MQLKHVALVCRSEDQSDRFYGTLLGLKKVRSKVLAPALSKRIFSQDHEYRMIDYTNRDIHFEIFISEHTKSNDGRLEHICLKVDNLSSFLRKCKEMEVQVLQVPKGKALVTFIYDYDGNAFEIKEKV